MIGERTPPTGSRDWGTRTAEAVEAVKAVEAAGAVPRGELEITSHSLASVSVVNDVSRHQPLELHQAPL